MPFFTHMATVYSVKEMFYTLQGEGAQAGRAAVFCRFAGCNLWNGRETDRSAAICQFCDTDFVGTDGVGGGKFESATELAQRIRAVWQAGAGKSIGKPYVVFTGGEPMLQLDDAVIEALHQVNFEVAIETNGTLAVPSSVDWVCVSPKFGAELVQTHGDEIKVVVPQIGQCPTDFDSLDFTHRFVQAKDEASPENKASNLRKAIDFCLNHPNWRLSVQIHKVIGMP